MKHILEDLSYSYELGNPMIPTKELEEVLEKAYQSEERLRENLKEKENEHILSVPEMDLLLYKKFKFERQIKNANIKLNYAALGPAIIYTNSDYSINEVSRAFKVGEKSVKREIDNIQSFQKPRSKKSRQFLDMIKN